MKKDIHPKVNKEAVVKCACGNTFKTLSTLDTINLEICGSCHPFYTGQRRFVDTERRIDKFNKKVDLMNEKKKAVEELKKSKAKKEKTIQKSTQTEKTVREILEELKSQETEEASN